MEVTPEHPVYVEGKGWVWAENLSIGDRLRRSDGGWAKVLAVERIKLTEAKQVYNFTVKGPHTYFVLEVGVLVHNASCNVERLKRNLEESRAAREASGFRQWAEDVESKAIQNIQQQRQQRLQQYWQQRWEKLRKQYNIPENAQMKSIYDVEPLEGDQDLRIWLGTNSANGIFDRAGNEIGFKPGGILNKPYTGEGIADQKSFFQPFWAGI